MRQHNGEFPGSASPGGRILSIADRIERKQIARMREQASKMHVREIETNVAWIETRKHIEGMDIDADLARLEGVDTLEGRRQRGEMRSLRGLQNCLLGKVEAGFAEWSEVAAEVPDLALPHFFRARWLMQSDPVEALKHFDRAAEVEPREANVYWRRGDCYAKIGDHERALANYRRAVALDPDSIDGLHAMGKSLVAIGETAEAVRYYDHAIALAPRYVDFYASRALALEVLDRHAAAVRDYDRIVELDPAHLVAHFSRARCRAKAGDVDLAIQELHALTEAHPEAREILLLLGKLYLKQERSSDALSVLSRAIELAPNKPDAWVQRALAFTQQGAWASAITNIERAVELAPDDPESLFFLILVRHQGHPADKLATIEEALERFPNAPFFLQERAELLTKQGFHARALDDWEKLVAAWPHEAEYCVGRAKALHVLQRMPEALEEASRAVELAPSNGMAYALRANCRSHLEGDATLITADWQRAVELDPNNTVIRYFRGRYLLDNLQHEAAFKDFDCVIELSPSFAEAYFYRAYSRFRIDEDHLDDDWEEDDAVREARNHACRTDLERAMELGFRDEDVFIELHWVYRACDEPILARTALDRGIETYPESSFLYTLRYNARRALNDEGAEADHLRAEQLQEAEQRQEAKQRQEAARAQHAEQTSSSRPS